MKKIIISILLLGGLSAHAQSNLPFKVVRDTAGKIDVIELQKPELSAMEADTFLEELRSGLEQHQSAKGINLEGLHRLKKDEQKAFLDSRDVFMNKDNQDLLDNKSMREEFAKAVRTLKSKKLFYTLAAPHQPGAFDMENLLVEAVDQILGAAEKVLGITTPVYTVFEFVVNEYFDALISRREFYQNALLVYLSTDAHGFTAAEIAAIKSSIFYSRIELYNLPARQKAQKSWASYGVNAEKKWLKKCKVTKATYFSSCFKHDGKAVYNLVDKKFKFSSSPSRTLNFTQPKVTGDERWMLLGARLALKLVPAPGLVKTPVNAWLKSFYVDQRKTEGLLYGEGLLADQASLNTWLKRNTANPTMKF